MRNPIGRAILVDVARSTRNPTSTFLRHYLEMVVAMILGMVVLGFVLGALLGLVGVEVGNWDRDQPELLLLGMAFTMTVPMVGWMRYRGHGWRAAGEMTTAMFAPSFVAIGFLQGGIAEDVHLLMMFEHVAMFVAMLAVMLLRRDEYTGTPAGRASDESGLGASA